MVNGLAVLDKLVAERGQSHWEGWVNPSVLNPFRRTALWLAFAAVDRLLLAGQ